MCRHYATVPVWRQHAVPTECSAFGAEAVARSSETQSGGCGDFLDKRVLMIDKSLPVCYKEAALLAMYAVCWRPNRQTVFIVDYQQEHPNYSQTHKEALSQCSATNGFGWRWY
jgi:hypothetical protein